MKKLIFDLVMCCCLIISVFLLSFCCSFHAQNAVRSLREQILLFPSEEAFDELLKSGDISELQEQASKIEAQLKKAGTSLAFFINYNSLSQAYTASASFTAAVTSKEAADYGIAKRTLLEALDNIERPEKLTWELFW